MYLPIQNGSTVKLGQIKFYDGIFTPPSPPSSQSSSQSSPQLSPQSTTTTSTSKFSQISIPPYIHITKISSHSLYYDKNACYRASILLYNNNSSFEDYFPVKDFFIRVDTKCDGNKEYYHGDEISYCVNYDQKTKLFQLMDISIKAEIVLQSLDE
ncbi:5766_t:CDS:1, partial [Diversispora eburnea]